VGIVKLLGVVREANPLVCEMATRTADMRGSWPMWGPLSGDPLVMDSVSAALLDWIQHRHNDPAVVRGCAGEKAAGRLARGSPSGGVGAG
jgi:hypothetical protein